MFAICCFAYQYIKITSTSVEHSGTLKHCCVILQLNIKRFFVSTGEGPSSLGDCPPAGSSGRTFLLCHALECKARYCDCMSFSVCNIAGSRAHWLDILETNCTDD